VKSICRNLTALLVCLGLFEGCAGHKETRVVLPNEHHVAAATHPARLSQDRHVQDRQSPGARVASPNDSEMETEKDRNGALAGTDADGALRFRRSRMVDDLGRIPPNALENARQQVLRMRRAQQARLESKRQAEQAGLAPAEPDAAGIEPDSWVWLGPGNVGGRIRTIAVHPTNTNTMWIGSVGGGIWRTDNGGTSWFPVNDFMANLAVTTIAIDPSNANNMYAGTGEGFGNGDALQGGGVFKSTDGGVTWNLLANTNPNATPPPVCGIGSTPCPAFWRSVSRLTISPNGSTILAATPLAVINGAAVDNGGIARSTDGGTTWTQVRNLPSSDILFLANDNNNVVEGELAVARYSSNGGQTWTPATFSPAINLGSSPPGSNGRVELSTSPANSSIVYAAVDQNGGDIYRSTDSGRNFTRVNTGNNIFAVGTGAALASQGWYANAIWQNPQDADTVVVGGTDLWRGTYNTTTSNLPLTQISDWTCAPGNACAGISAHADHHAIVSHPGFNNSSNRTVYFANDGGIYRASDVTTVSKTSGWTALNNGLGITQFFAAAANQSSGVYIAGAQDNGTQRYSGNANLWTAGTDTSSRTLGDGGFCAADPADPNYFYGEYIYLQIYRSTDGGQKFSYIYANGLSDAASKTTANFIAPFALDPSNSNTLWGGGINLWRTQDAKAATPTWSNVKGTTTSNSPVTAIGISPATSTFVVVGHQNGDIYRTFTGTSVPPSWTQINVPGVSRFIGAIVIDPNSSHSNSWIYVAYGGFVNNNVYRSTDFGATWTSVSGTGSTALPAVPVYSFAVHPVDPNLLYAGTEIGIFVSQDGGTNWEPTQDGPANVSVDQLFWFAGDLVAATHGRGLYRASGGTYVDHNYSGIENGSLAQPYNTVTEGVNAVQRYQAVWMRPASYNETLTINKRLELRSIGGTATIGR
jgi:hypothetical protein